MIKQKEKLSKKFPELLTQVAHYYIEEARLHKAVKTVGKLLNKFPDDINGLLLIAMIQEKQGQFDEAESSYRNVIEIDPKNIRAITRLANLEELRPDTSDYWKRNLFLVDPLSPLVKGLRITEKIEEIAVDETVSADGESEDLANAEPPIEEEQIPLDADLLQGIEGIYDSAGIDTMQKPDVIDISLQKEEVIPAEDTVETAADSIEDASSDTDSTIEPEDELGDSAAAVSKAPSQDEYIETTPPPALESDTLELDSGGIQELDIPGTEELDELPPEPEPVGEKYTPFPSEVDELQRVYREIKEHPTENPLPASPTQPNEIKTVTLAEIYAAQGSYAKALEIYNALPDDEKPPHEYRIQELEAKLKEQQNQNNS